LTEEQMNSEFWGSFPQANEIAYDFVLRVEAARLRLGESDANTYKCFAARVPDPLGAELR
jgi:hypothetical protein